MSTTVDGAPGVSRGPVPRRTVLTGMSGAALAVALERWAHAKPRPKPGTYSNVYSDRYGG
jgi:hypothetical protein